MTEQYNNALKQGEVLNGTSYKYLIERVLGQGSFGITYLASVKMAGALGAIDANIKVAIKEFFMKDINGRSDATVTSGSKGGLYDEYKHKFTREAAYQLGEMYRFGKDVVADSVLSLKWHTEAAKQGMPESQFVVGTNAYNAKNYSYAYELFTDAAKNGIKGAKGYLGIMYYYGLYVAKDYPQAFTLLKECAEAGEIPEVMRVLAACYRYGLGTTENIEKEKYWINQAALHNDVKAQKIISYTGL